MKKIAIFADIQNIYYTCRQAYHRQFDYRTLYRRVAVLGEITVANAYAIDRGDQGQRKFQNALRQMGFNIKLKPYIQRSDGSAKGDWDVGITIDVMKTAAHVDSIVLLSGDGDFDLLLESLAADGVESQVYGVPSLTADSLINAADSFHPIDERLLL